MIPPVSHLLEYSRIARNSDHKTNRQRTSLADLKEKIAAMNSPFAPSKITLSTLSRLLSLYPTTAKGVYRAKLLAKASSKKPKGTANRGKNQKTAAKDDTSESDPPVLSPGVEEEVKKFHDLDIWRFETLPRILRDRLGAELDRGDDEEERPAKRARRSDRGSHATKETEKSGTGKESASNFFLEKDEVVSLMDWKLKHGSFRPALLGMIQSNTEANIKTATRSAFNALPGSSTEVPFPATSLQTLCDALRAVGPATGSLILSVLPVDPSPEIGKCSYGIPFFSDELFWWLCLDVYPGSMSTNTKQSLKKMMKYNVKEYRQLFEAVNEFRERIHDASCVDREAGGSGTSFSTLDVEKIAFVIGHIEISGYEGDEDDEQPSKSGDSQLREDVKEDGDKASSPDNEEKGGGEEVEKEGRRITRSETKRISIK